MANKDFKTWCRVMEYIEEKDENLARLLRGTCADMTLNSTKGKNGITFLWPQDKTYVKKIEDLAYSANPDDASKACDMLNALILRDVFKNASDFRGRVVPNSLWPSQQLDATVDGKTVKFSSGATAVIDPDFKDASKKRNLAVWKLTGEIPVTTDKPADLSRLARPKKGKTGAKGGKNGGYVPSDSHMQKERFQIALIVENEYAMERMSNSTSDPFIERTASLVQYLQKKGYDMEKIVPMLSRMKLDFYILVQPHQHNGEYLVSDDDLLDWWRTQPSAPSDINKFYDELLESQSAKIKEVSEKRKAVLERMNKPRDLICHIRQAYNDFYPEYAARKMLHDDLRYVTFYAFDQLEKGPFDTGKFNEIVNMIGEALYCGDGVLLNENNLKYAVDASNKVQQIKKFINSTLFLNVHCKTTEAELAKSTVDIYNGEDKLINFNKVEYSKHDRNKDKIIEKVLSLIDDPDKVAAIKKLLDMK